MTAKNRSLAQTHINRNGLPEGSVAPNFSAPLLNGGCFRLNDVNAQRILLIFSNPECPPCNDLLSKLPFLRSRTPDVEIVIISRGAVASNLEKATQYQISLPIVLQRRSEIARRYAMFATPAGYLLDQNRRIVGNVAVGKRAVLQLLLAAQIVTLLSYVEE